MIDFIKKSMLTGLGLAYMTKEKIAETARDLAESAKLSEEEGRKLYDHLLNESAKTRKDIEEKINGTVNAAIGKLPTSRKIDDLASRVEQLEKTVSSGSDADEPATERSDVITFKGGPLTLQGTPVAVGDTAPAFIAINPALEPVKLSDYAGKVVVISSVPSLDTPVCEQQTRRFNEEAAGLDAVILSISMDLPFAASRFCDTHGIDKVVTLSDYQDKAFGNAYGLLIKELQLLARAVHVVDTEGNIAHAEIVGEVTDHPDYDQVLEVIKGL